MADGPRYDHDDTDDDFFCQYEEFDVWLDVRGDRRPYITLRFEDYEPLSKNQSRFVFRSAEEIRQASITFINKDMNVDIHELANLIDAILSTAGRTTS